MANSLNTITVDGVTYDAAEYAKEHTVTKANDELGKDAFLQLLVAQMKYQDPLSPQDNSEYIAELANFSSLEQMTNVAKGIEDLSTIVGNIDTSVLVGQLSSMIGKNINWNTSVVVPGEDGKALTRNQTIEGIVRGITMTDSANPMVVAEANGVTYKVAISDITKVYEAGDDPTTAQGTTTGEAAQDGETTQNTKTNATPTIMGAFTNASSDFTSPSENTTTVKSGPTINGPFTYSTR